MARLVVGIRSDLLSSGLRQPLSQNKKGYLFVNGTGEQVRIMRRGSAWDVRVRNAAGNNLDEFGNVAPPSATHGIEGFSP